MNSIILAALLGTFGDYQNAKSIVVGGEATAEITAACKRHGLIVEAEHEHFVICKMSTDLTPAQLAALANEPVVRYVEPDYEVHLASWAEQLAVVICVIIVTIMAVIIDIKYSRRRTNEFGH